MSVITTIENLSHDELKAQKAELVKQLSAVDAATLAARFLQARTDAKGRDELLAKQGKEITEQAETLAMLKDGAGLLKAKVSELEAQSASVRAALQEAEQKVQEVTKEAAAQLAKAHQNAAAAAQALKKELAEAHDSLKAEQARANKMKSLAIKNHQAMSTILKLASDSCSSHAVEAADNAQ